MMMREKIAISLGIVFIGMTGYDAAFTEAPAPVARELPEYPEPKPKPQDASQAPVTPDPVPVDPCAGFEWCAVTEGKGLALTPEGRIKEQIEELKSAVEDAGQADDAEQQAEDGE